MKRKIIALTIAFIMLFSIGTMTACITVRDNPILLQQIQELQTQLYNLNKAVQDGNKQNDDLLQQTQELLTQLEAMQSALTALQGQINNPDTGLLAQVAALERQISDLRERLRGDEEDFVLTISVDSSTVTHGQRIFASAELKNNSGRAHEIMVPAFLIYFPTMEGWLEHISIFPPRPQSIHLDIEGILTCSEIFSVLVGQELGTYELRAVASFYLSHGQENEERVLIWSNTIVITVVDQIDEREWGYSDCGRFALSIAATQNTLPYGQNFVVNVMLKNNTDQDFIISYYPFYSQSHRGLFYPLIENWCFFGVPMPLPPTNLLPPRQAPFAAGSIFCSDIDPILGFSPFGDNNYWTIGDFLHGIGMDERPFNFLDKGTHELTFSAEFFIGEVGTLQNSVSFFSNPIVLTVEGYSPATADCLSLSITASKSQISMGESIDITLTLENKNGRPVPMWDWTWGNLPQNPFDSIAQTALIPVGRSHHGHIVGGLGTRLGLWLPPNAPEWQHVLVIDDLHYTRTDTFTLDDSLWWWNNFDLANSDVEYFIVEAYVGFYVARGHHNEFVVLWDEIRIDFVR